MILTKENYFSSEADNFYLSVSQYHNFWGTPGFSGCEAKALAKLRGEWEDEKGTAMMVGSYVDEYFSGDLDKFKTENPQIFTQKGELLAPFRKANEIIANAEADEFFMRHIKGTGIQQMIVTGEINGVKWKGKLDNVHPGLAIVDLKVIASIRDKVWCDFTHDKKNFIEAYGYVDQAAVYQELYFQMTGERLPFFIAAITKEDYPDKEVVFIPDSMLERALDEIKGRQDYIVQMKSGEYPAVHCGKCNYCRSVKKLDSTIDISALDV